MIAATLQGTCEYSYTWKVLLSNFSQSDCNCLQAALKMMPCQIFVNSTKCSKNLKINSTLLDFYLFIFLYLYFKWKAPTKNRKVNSDHKFLGTAFICQPHKSIFIGNSLDNLNYFFCQSKTNTYFALKFFISFDKTIFDRNCDKYKVVRQILFYFFLI